jgi:hypothetical protein
MTTERSNVVILSSSLISSVEPIQSSVVITSGQPFDTQPTIAQSGSKWTITLDAGRQASGAVAVQFLAAAGSEYHIYPNPTTVSQTDKPGALNFYFGVTVSFNQGFPPVALLLAQGSTAISNNWWVGSKNLFNSSPGSTNLAFLVANGLVRELSYSSKEGNLFFID